MVRGNLTVSSISKGPNFKVRSRSGQCGLERRCVAPRISELGEGRSQQVCWELGAENGDQESKLLTDPLPPPNRPTRFSPARLVDL
jgi:hypothetical protein